MRERTEDAARSVRASLARLGRDVRSLFSRAPHLEALPPTDEPYATVIAANDDDLASVTGRIDTAPDMTVVLLVPTRARGFRNPGMWPHLAAHVRRRGITLGVVCARRDVRGHASENGLPAARSVAGLFRSPRRRLLLGSRSLLLPNVGLRRVGTFALIATFVVITGLVGCVAVPSAQVTITPPSEPFTTTLHADVSTLAGTGDVGGAVVAASSLRLTVRTVVSTSTTGTVDVPDKHATVELTFTNKGPAGYSVPPLTEVATAEGVVFRTDTGVEVPSTQSNTVMATAANGGSGGNVTAASLTLAPTLPAGVTVSNRRAATGGSEKSVPAIAQADFDRIRGIADTVLRRVGLRELQRSMTGNGAVFPETLNVAILSLTPLGQVGDPADVAMVEYQAVATALGLPEETLRAFGAKMLAGALRPGYALLPGTADAKVSGEAAAEDGTVSVDLVASGRVAPELPAREIRAAIAGQSPDAARRRLVEMLSLDQPPDIALRPALVPWLWLPRRESRIAIVLGGPAEPAEAAATATATPSASATASATATATATPAGTAGAR